jgi:hypothetical protein
MWDIFFAFVLLGGGAILAFYELRQWFATKKWIHLVAILAAVISEAAIIKGFLEAVIMLVFALVIVVLAFMAESKRGTES